MFPWAEYYRVDHIGRGGERRRSRSNLGRDEGFFPGGRVEREERPRWALLLHKGPQAGIFTYKVSMYARVVFTSECLYFYNFFYV